MSNKVDIHENDILRQDPELLELLLMDRSRPKNGKKTAHIIWATDNYKSRGKEYAEDAQISIASITGENGSVVVPRTKKTLDEQRYRSREKAEVFTPSWICNAQNNLIDNAWFASEGTFNTETEKSWRTNPQKIPFLTADGKTWQDYVKDTRLEITCGEAPYLVSRYDTITGKPIPVSDRIGLLDRKLRVVGENTTTEEDWLNWAKEAYKSIYGYEWQGDNLLLARENLLFTFIDYHKSKFGTDPDATATREIAEIISWNIWQMDGLKGVIPNSCHDEEVEISSLFDNSEKIVSKCPGCKNDDIRRHNGIYCMIMDWETGKPLRFINLLKK